MRWAEPRTEQRPGEVDIKAIMLFLFAGAVLVASGLGQDCGVPQIKPIISGYPKIVNGETAVSGSWPWQVSLQTQGGFHFCGGSLVNENWVVTAAHCEVSPRRHRVILGEHDRLSNSEQIQVLSVSRAITHPNYDPRRINNDVMLLKLSTPAQIMNRVSPVCMANTTTIIAAGTQCVTTGWGRTRNGGGSPRFLQQTALPVRSPAQCRQVWGQAITDAMICAGAAGSSSCQGDSGGPLVCEDNGVWSLVGIVSWGTANCNVNFPAVYARVSFLRSWIDETIASN